MRRATENAHRAFEEIREADLVILTGVAGALADKLEIGDAILGDRLMTRAGDDAHPRARSRSHAPTSTRLRPLWMQPESATRAARSSR